MAFSLMIFLLAAIFRPSAGGISHQPCNPIVRISSPTLNLDESVYDSDWNMTFPKGKWYTTNQRHPKGVEYWGCPCNLEKPCLRKCCPAGQYFTADSDECQPDHYGPQGIIVHANGYQSKVAPLTDYFFLQEFKCDSGLNRLRPEKFHDNSFSIGKSDGKLSIHIPGVTDIDMNGFCVESDDGSSSNLVPFVCHSARTWGEISTRSPAAFLYLRLIPMPFMLISLAVTLRRKEQTLNKCGSCLLISLMVARAIYVIATVNSVVAEELPSYSYAIAIQFLLLSSAFWLSAMCLESFLTSRTPAMFSVELGKEKYPIRNFIACSLYAWGWPIVITSVAYITTEEPNPPINEINPRHAFTRNWIYVMGATQRCLLGSDAVLLSSNLFLCAFAAISLHCLGMKLYAHNDPEMLSRKRNNLYTCVALLIVVAINRASETAVWLLPHPYERIGSLDIMNSMQDFGVALALAWPEVKNALRTRQSLLIESSGLKYDSVTDLRGLQKT